MMLLSYLRGELRTGAPAAVGELWILHRPHPPRARLESIDAFNKIVEEAHKRIQTTSTADLFTALRGCPNDSTKNLVMVTLSTIGGLASAMGPSVEKSKKGIF